MNVAAEASEAGHQRDVEQHRSTTSFVIPVVLLILLGAALRLWAFAGGRSFWLDEAMIALNIIHLPLPNLFGALELNQFAPLGWLLIEKTSLALFSNFEYSLRLPALIFGTGSLVVFYYLAKLVLTAKETILALAMFAVSSNLIYYSAEAKSYILDALFSGAILALAYCALSRPAARVRLTLWLALVGAVCAVLTFGALLVLASTGLVLFAAALASKDRKWAVSLVLTGLLWCGAFGVLYLAHYGKYSDVIGAENFSRYWSETFAPAPVTASGIIWYVKAAHMLVNFIHNGLHNFPLLTGFNALLTGGAMLVGLHDLWRRQRWHALLFVGPVFLALLAAAFQAYPMMGRFHLALAPPLIVLTARGAGVMAGRLSGNRLLFPAISLLILLTPSVVTFSKASHNPPWAIEEIEESLAHVAQHRRPTDLFMLTSPSVPAFLLYTQQENLDGLHLLVIGNRIEDAECIARNSGRSPPYRRAWWLISHESERDKKGNSAYLSSLESGNKVTQVQSGRGTKLYEIVDEGRSAHSLWPLICQLPATLSPFEKGLADRAGLIPVGLERQPALPPR